MSVQFLFMSLVVFAAAHLSSKEGTAQKNLRTAGLSIKDYFRGTYFEL